MSAPLDILLYTTQDRSELLQELDLCKRSFFQTTQSPDLAHLGLRDRSLPFWMEFFAGGQLSVPELDRLRAQIAAYRVVRITLAFEPDTHFIHKLVTKVREMTGVTEYLAAIELVSALSVGVVMTIDGKLIDRSLRKKLRSLDFETILKPYLPVLSS